MKNMISFFAIALSAGLLFTSCQKEPVSTPAALVVKNTAVSHHKPTKELQYFDFSKYQVVKGGLTSAQIETYLSEGWSTGTFIVDYSTICSFKNSGGIYTADGVIAKGVNCVYKPNTGDIIIVEGGNLCALQEEVKGFSQIIR